MTRRDGARLSVPADHRITTSLTTATLGNCLRKLDSYRADATRCCAESRTTQFGRDRPDRTHRGDRWQLCGDRRPAELSIVVCGVHAVRCAVICRSDLERLDRSPHPAPEDMQRLRNLERLKLALPIRGMRLSACGSLSDSIRLAVHRFFCTAKIEGIPLVSTLAWLIFELYRPAGQRVASWHLATDPTAPDGRGVDLMAAAMRLTLRLPVKWIRPGGFTSLTFCDYTRGSTKRLAQEASSLTC